MPKDVLRNKLLGGDADISDKVPDNFELTERAAMVGMAWPMLVSFFCRMGMASVDSAFVGHITNGEHGPKEYLAAAGLSDMVTNILIIPPLAFNQSLNALVSQAMGSGNKKMAGTWLQLSVFWLTLSYIPCLVSFFYVGEILTWLGFSQTICTLAATYARYNVFWPIPNGWYQCMRFYFQAQGVTRPAMYNNMIFLVVNVMLNWIFVFGGPFQLCGWNGFGFVGAAISLSVSRCSQPLFYWLYMFAWKGRHRQTWPGWSLLFLQRERVRAFMHQSLPQVGTLIFQAALGQTTTLLIAQLGRLAIASSAAVTALTQVFTGGLAATLCAVCGIRVGFHLGDGHGAHARYAACMVFKYSFISVAIIAVLLVPFGYQAISLITPDEDIINTAALLVPPTLLNTFAGLIVECNTGGVFTSQGRTILSTVLSMGVELPLSIGSVVLIVLYLHWGVVSVYWAQAAVSCFEMVLVSAVFLTSDWPRYAKDAQRRQEAEEEAGSPRVTHCSSSISLSSSQALQRGSSAHSVSIQRSMSRVSQQELAASVAVNDDDESMDAPDFMLRVEEGS